MSTAHVVALERSHARAQAASRVHVSCCRFPAAFFLPALLLLLLATACGGSLGRAVAEDKQPLQAQLEQVLAAMAAASLAGDAAAYLEHISRADPVFLMEQQNWAKDLAEHTPVQLEYTISSDLQLRDSIATADVRVDWRMEAGPARTLTYPAKFVQTGDAGWRFAGEDWKVIEGDRLQVLYFKGFDPIARNAAADFPEVRVGVTAAMGLDDDQQFAAHVQQIKIYPSMAHLQQSIYLSYSEPLAGWNEPGESIKLLTTLGMGRRSLRSLLAHEFGHVASFQYGDQAITMPWWILEGVAELVAEPWANNGGRTDQTVRRWARTDDLRDWEDLADFRGEAMNHTLHVYRQGHQMLRFITSRFGAQARNEWMMAMAQGATIDQATRDVLGLSFEELDEQWRAEIGAKFPARGVQIIPKLPHSVAFAA